MDLNQCYDNTIITSILQMYFLGMGVRKIADYYDMFGRHISHDHI